MNNIFKLKNKILILSLFLLILSGCSNKSFVGNYKFDYIDDKDEVRKNGWDPEDFNDDELEEDDYYYEDDN